MFKRDIFKLDQSERPKKMTLAFITIQLGVKLRGAVVVGVNAAEMSSNFVVCISCIVGHSYFTTSTRTPSPLQDLPGRGVCKHAARSDKSQSLSCHISNTKSVWCQILPLWEKCIYLSCVLPPARCIQAALSPKSYMVFPVVWLRLKFLFPAVCTTCKKGQPWKIS